MSKASEWAKQYADAMAAEPVRFRDPRCPKEPGPYIDLEVDTQGGCSWKKNGGWEASLPPEVALALARWIIDTFGEPDAKLG